jgi:hypothetical protein
LLRNISSPRRHAATTPLSSNATPPPSIGHASSRHEPVPSFVALANRPDSVDRTMYMSRLPSTLFRNMTTIHPSRSMATDGAEPATSLITTGAAHDFP